MPYGSCGPSPGEANALVVARWDTGLFGVTEDIDL